MKTVWSALRRNGYEFLVARTKVMPCAENHTTPWLNFARLGLTWSRQVLENTAFSDEFWASGGANRRSLVLVAFEGDKEEKQRD